jgi:hypothetical protein
MKFSFRKIAAVLAGAVMLGSTIGFAANYPAPFVQGGQADVAVVYGSTATLDLAAATSIASDLAKGVTTTSAEVGAGEKVLLQKGSTKFNIGSNASGVWGAASLVKSDMPTLLGDGTFSNKAGNEYAYTQRITLGNNLIFTHFADTDYKSSLPTVGFKLNSGTHILNYTLDFTTDVESVVSTAGRLTDIESKTIPLLGKNYYILSAENGTSSTTAKLTLLDSANEATVIEGTPATVTLGTKSYAVDADIGSDYVILSINGETTDKLAEGATKKLADGTVIGVKSIIYKSKESATSKVIISLGTGKLILSNAQDVDLNGETISNLKAYVTKGTPSSGKEKLDKIVIEWKLDDKKFITPDQSLLMPGFEAVQIITTGMTFPAEEQSSVQNDGNDVMTLKAPIKDGDVTLKLLGSNTTKFVSIGGKSDESDKLKTASSTAIYLNYTNNERQFVASWASTRDAESHLMSIASISQSNGVNKTIIKDKLTNSEYEMTDSSAGATITVGNVILTLTGIGYSDNEKNVSLSINSGGSFSKVYTKEGMTMYLPVNSVAAGPGNINLTANNEPTTWKLYMVEEDKDGNIGAGSWINSTLGLTGTDGKAQVNSVTTNWAGSFSEIGDTGVYEGYALSALASKVLNDQDASQDNVKVIYHGAESYANVYVAAPSVTTGAAAALVPVKDSEASSVSGKNLIVVGGSCVNTVAAQVLGSATPVCGDAFTAATGVGANQALIQVATSPLSATKIAMLVAGYEAADTEKAAKYVTTSKPSTAVGTVKLSTVDVATPITA